MGNTFKDSSRRATNLNSLRIEKGNDGSFDLFLNGELIQARIPERWLPSEICERFGFCGQEYEAILHEARQSDSATVTF
ncbi:MAG TPA: hypothetical protein VHZ52_09795 [Acidobacteriaceae bacterium]|jgi:hypothetical protein|nr:hypothetical protein [Acidobacteriaceae bacterium]